MSPLLRCGLLIAALAGAFAAGFFLKPAPTIRHVVAASPAAQPSVPPPIHEPQVKPAVVLGAPEPADPLDAAGMAMIRKEMGIKTTILDKNEPVPAVLASAGTGPPIPKADLDIPIGPVPMPRLDPPPLPDIPKINVSPPPPPPSIHVPPLGSVTRPVNDRNVALDFALTRTGSSPVKAVELWTTRDGGNTWAKTDRITGCTSPFRTRLGSDGQYGFRLVVESEAGMQSPEPRPGTPADHTIWLDTTPPKVSVLAPGRIDGSPNRVRLSWTATDANLDRAWARVEYSTDGRAWMPVVPELRHPHDSPSEPARVWAVPPGLPHRVMLRVTVRDTAGNEATAELPKSVSIDLVAPAGKVTGLHGPGLDVGPTPRVVDVPAQALLLAPLLGSPVLGW